MKSLRFPAYLLVAAAGIGLFFLFTRTYQLGIAPDSVSYVSMAHHIAAGRGVAVFMQNHAKVSEPIAAFAPLYPVLLAPFSLAKQDLYSSAWILQGLFFGLNIALASFLVRRITGSERWAFLCALTLLLDTRLFHYHAWLLSEPLFIFLMLLSVYCLWKFLMDGGRTAFWLSAAFIGAASLARYIGIAFAAGGALCILVFYTRESAQKRLRTAAAFGFLSLLCFIAWSIRNRLVTRFPGKTLPTALYGSLMHEGAEPMPFLDSLSQSIRDMVVWAMAGPWYDTNFLWVYAAIWTVLAAGLLAGVSKQAASDALRMGQIFAIQAVTYLLVLITLLFFCRFSVQVPDRYLYPFYLMIFLAGVSYMSCLTGSAVRSGGRGKLWTAGFLLIWVLWLGVRSVDAYQTAQTTLLNGADESKGIRAKYTRRIQWLPSLETP